MKDDLADKESLEAQKAQQQEESRENCKMLSEQKAVSKHYMLLKTNISSSVFPTQSNKKIHA